MPSNWVKNEVLHTSVPLFKQGGNNKTHPFPYNSLKPKFFLIQSYEVRKPAFWSTTFRVLSEFFTLLSHSSRNHQALIQWCGGDPLTSTRDISSEVPHLKYLSIILLWTKPCHSYNLSKMLPIWTVIVRIAAQVPVLKIHH